MHKLIVLVTLLLLAGLPSGAEAALMRAGSDVAIADAVLDDVYAAAGSVAVTAPVTGDLIAAGGNILVTAPVTGDGILAGGTINVLGAVSDDLRAAGGNVSITSMVGDDLLLAGGQISMLPGSGVGGDAYLNGGSVAVSGTVHGNLEVNGREVTIAGTIDGNATINAERVTIADSAVIGGTLTYRSRDDAQIAPGAKIGAVERKPLPQAPYGAKVAGITAWTLLTLLMLFVGALVIRALFAAALPKMLSVVDHQFWRTLGIGFLILVVTPVAAVIGFVTVIGIPLAAALLLFYAVLLLLSYLLTPIIAGSLLWKYFSKSPNYPITWQSIILGALVLVLLHYLPFVGQLITVGLLLLALGTLASHAYGHREAFRGE